MDPAPSAAAGGSLKDAFLAEVRKHKPSFYNMVVAQARTIEVGVDQIVFTFSPSQKFLSDQVGQSRAWLESAARQASGRRFTVSSVTTEAGAQPLSGSGSEPRKADGDRKSALREQALADAGVQTMLEVFPGEIRDVEEM